MFLGVGCGGVGWGGAITFTYLRTPMMLRHGTFTCTCAHTSCYVEDVSRHAGVGWGGAITFTYLRTHMMLRHGTFTCTCAHTSCHVEDVSRHAGVGWGNNVHVLARSHDVTPRHVHLHVRTYVMLRWRYVTSRRGGVGWGNNVHVLAQMAQSATLDWHRLTSWYILPAHIATTNLWKRSADMLEKPSGFILAPLTRAGVWSKPVFPISWHLAQKTNKNWMTSFGRTVAHGSGDGRQM